MVRPSGELRRLRSQLAATLASAAASSESPAAPAVVANASLSMISSASGGKSSTFNGSGLFSGMQDSQSDLANAKAAAATAAVAWDVMRVG